MRVPARTRASAPIRSRLLPPLTDRLPALAGALDDDVVVGRLQPLVVDGARVLTTTAGSVWFRDDGSCSLRYHVQVAAEGEPGASPHLVLTRVCPSEPAARRYLSEVQAVAPSTGPPAPWRSWYWRTDDAPVVFHPFPLDPAVPVLRAVAELEQERPESWPAWAGAAPSVEVVRHPREGGVVLRCGGRPGTGSPDSTGTFYAKVYPDATGATVHRFLSTLDRDALSSGPFPVRLPRSLGYRPHLQLLLTEALPGQPVIPALVQQVLAPAPDHAHAAHLTDLRAAVREAGRVLGALHAIAHATAPRRGPDQAWQDLDHQLRVVTHLWPETANAIRTRLATEPPRTTVPSERVLCHGDYTPSQILFRDGQASGLVDFDTVCWGDPAMDLGRFLAHLDLLLAKAEGRVSESLGQHLRDDLLGAYEASTRRRTDPALVVRVDSFRAVALAVTALHACRQLKERRLDLALSLLSTTSAIAPTT